MAQTNKQMIIKLCNEINKKEGQGSIYTIGSKNANLKINRWSTGIEDLDAIIGGGMPEGRVVEIFGPESSGKTTLLYHLASMHAMALDIPIEYNILGHRNKKCYPNPVFWEIAAEVGNKTVLGYDAHDPKALLESEVYSECVSVLKSFGITPIGFDEIEIKTIY